MAAQQSIILTIGMSGRSEVLRKRARHTLDRLAAARAARAHRAEVERFCLFLGFPRSGSSLVGQLLNAHRHAVVSHEADALRHLEAGATRDRLYGAILARDRTFCAQGMSGAGGYEFEIEGQWQGRFERLRVIGDKKAARSSAALDRRPELLDRLRSTVGVPLRIVNVVRNPYDNITTMAQRTDTTLEQAAGRYFTMAATVARTRASLDADEVIEVHHEELVADPQAQLARLCEFVDVDAPTDYLAACEAIVFPSHSRTRESQPWPEALIDDVARRAADLDFLGGYRFT